MEYTPGPGLDAGTILASNDLVPLSFLNVGVSAPAQLHFANTGGAREDVLVIHGSSEDNLFGASGAAGVVQFGVFGSGGGVWLTKQVATPGVSALEFNGNGGRDTFNVRQTVPFLVAALGDGNDELFYRADVGDLTQVALVAQFIFGPSNYVKYYGIEHIIVDGESGSLKVQGFGPNDAFHYTPSADLYDLGTLNDEGLISLEGPYADVQFYDVAGTLEIDGGNFDQDIITVHGTSGNNAISVVRGASTTVQVGSFKTLTLNGAEDHLVIDGGLGDDTITVTGSGGPALTVDGGGPSASDTLDITTGSNAAVSVNYGSDPTAGVVTDNVAGNVSFVGIEVLNLTGTGAATSLSVNGTNGNDAINQSGNSVTVNNGTAVNFAAYPTLSLNGNNGDDVISVWPATLVGVTTFNVAGGDPTASDILVVNGTTGNDAIGYDPSTTLGSGSVTIAGAATVNFTTTEAVVIDGQGGTDALTLTTPAGVHQVTYTPGSAPDSGRIATRGAGAGTALVPLTFAHIGASGSVTFASVGGREDVLELNGTGDSDVLNVNSPADAIQVLNPTGGFVTDRLNTGGVNILELRGLNGDDTFNLSATLPYAGGTLVDGGDPSASDVLNFTGSDAAAVLVDLGAASVTEINPVTYTGIERLNVNAINQLLTVAATGGDDVMTVTPLTATSGTLQINGAAPVVDYVTTNTFTVDLGGGTDRLVVNGTSGDDNGANSIVATATAVAVGARLPVTYSAANAESLHLNGLSGDDTIDIDNTGGLLLPAGGVYVDGNGGRDTLRMIGGTAVGSATFNVGPDAGNGSVIHDAERVYFSNLEPVIDLVVAATLTVNATNADNAINYSAIGANGLVSIDGFETVEFANKTGLVINALSGNDVVNLNNPTTPAGLAGITVNGGDATSGDRLVVNGVAAALDAVTYQPTGLGAGNVTGAGPVGITFSGTERLEIDGQGGNDTLTLDTVNIDGTQVLTPGIADDAGTVEFRNNGLGAFVATTVGFRNLDAGGSLTFTDSGRFDNLIYNGTELDDTFGVNTGGVVTLNNRIVVNTPSIITLTLAGLVGDDTFNIAGNHNLPGIAVQGGDPSASDVLNFNGSGAGAVAVDWGAGSVTEINPVTYTGIETINANANGQAFSVAGTANDDEIMVTVLGAASGKVQLGLSLLRLGEQPHESIAPLVNYTNILGALLVDLAGGEDTLAVVGNASSQTFNINDDEVPFLLNLPPYGPIFVPANTVQVDDGSDLIVDGSVTWLNNESLQVAGLEGNDTFHVIPLAGPGVPNDPNSIPIFVDGGDPIGTSAGDRLVAFGNGNPAMLEAGPERDEGGIVYGDPERVSFDHIEAVAIVEPTSVIILGTNADDDITIVAVDAVSTPQYPGTDGVRDFTAVVNDGLEVLYINVGGAVPPGPPVGIGYLHIDGLAGDDDVILRTPAPNGAGWSMRVEVAGGLPSDGADNEGDRLVLETPGTDTVYYTPTGSDTGTVLIDENANATFEAGDTLIVIGQFFNADPPISYDSSPGGVELFEYDGEAGDDVFILVGTAGNDTITHTPGGANDEGRLRINSLLGVSYQNLGAVATLTVTGGTAGTDTLVVEGTLASDAFAVAAGTGAVSLNSRLVLNQTSIENLTLQGLQGDDTFTLNGPSPYTSTIVDGGDPSASDVIKLTGATAAVVITLADSAVPSNTTVTGFGGTVTLVGNEVLNANAGAQAVTVSGTANPDSLSVTPTGANTATITSAGLNLVVHTTNTGTLTVDAAGGADTVSIHGTSAADVIGVAKGATTTVQVGALKAVSLPSASDENVTILAGDGNDTINVSGTTNNNQIVNVVGGDPSSNTPVAGDTLNVTMATAGATLVSPGATPDSGAVFSPDGTTEFAGLEFISLIGAAGANSLDALGTHDDDSIALQLTAGQTNRIWVNDRAVIDFSNFGVVNLFGQFGADRFSVTPVGLVGVTAINVAGRDPTGGDTLIVNGTNPGPALDTVTITPTAADAGTVAIAGSPIVSFTTTESLLYNGLGGNDLLTFVTPAGSTTTYTPGTTPDSASLQVAGLAPMAFTNLGNGAQTVQLSTTAGGVLVYQGTNANDTFGVATGAPTTDGRVTLNGQLPVETTAFTALTLNGFDGDDTFNVTGSATLPYTSMLLSGGNPSASDVANLTGNGTAITANIGDTTGVAATVLGGGLGTVTLTSVEIANINAATGDLTLNTSTGDDTLVVTPTGANSVTAQANGLTPVVNGSNIGVFNVALVGGSDRLVVNGNQGNNAIAVSGTAVSVDALEAVNYTGAEFLTVNGQAGNDVFTVTPAAGTSIFIDGGDPIGSTAGDRVILLPPGAFVIEPGPEGDEGGMNSAGAQRVSWDHIEALAVVGGGPGLTLGTNGDDDITIIARDASYDPLADGLQDFTVSVNDGPEILYINNSVHLVDAMAGDDDIVVREPAPNSVVWNVQLYIAGGTAATPTSDQGDVLEVETPGTQTVVFTPNPAVIPVPVLPAGVTITPATGGIDTAIISDTTNTSQIAAAPFNFSVVGFLNYNSSPGGVEQVLYQGLAGGDNLTINGTSADDMTVISPTGTGSGAFRSSLSPAFDFVGATAVTVNGGAGGFDLLNILGTEGPDTVTSTATVITLVGTVAIGPNMDKVALYTFGGNDNIDLDLNVAGLEKLVDAGAGDDRVDLSGTLDATIFGGDGDDVLIGTPLADFIDGGRGNDTIDGGSGDDVIYGGEGDDDIEGDSGDDQLFGGDGSDRFTWDPGDGSDLVEGGANESDVLVFNGAAVPEVFTLTENGTRLRLTRDVGGVVMDMAGVELVDLFALGGADTVTVADLTQTDVKRVNVDLGGADAAADNLFVDGRTVADNVLITASAGTVSVIGLRYDVKATGTQAAGAADRLTFRGNDGDDTIKAAAGVEGTILITLDGGFGNDNLSADAILIGGPGNDFLEGGAGADQLFGNEGEDTMIGRGGADTFDGGPDFDTILIEGTSGPDVIDVRQTSATTLLHTVNGDLQTDTMVAGTVEQARVEAGAGADVMRVAIADGLFDEPGMSLRMTVFGGLDSTMDRLGIVDDGVDDLTLYRKGELDSTGTVVVGPGNAEPFEHVFEQVERVQFVDEAGNPLNGPPSPTSPFARLVVFKHDPFEFNDDRFTATHLGANQTINVDPTIDPGLDPNFGLPADQDWYRVEAEVSGTLDLQVFFEELPVLGSGRPGLPGDGNLDIFLYDVDGTLIAGPGPAFGGNNGGGLNPELNVDGDAFAENERIRIPAVQGQVYYLQVRGVATAINNYTITVINTVAPTPFDLELDDAVIDGIPPDGSDTGRNNTDNITRDNTPTIYLRLDDGFFLQDLPGNSTPDTPPDEVIPIPFRAGPAQPLLPGYAIAIFDEGDTPGKPADALQVPLGFATATADPGVYVFTTPVLADGSHFLTARVQMIDPAVPQQRGFGPRSLSLEIVVDIVEPPVSFGLPTDPDDGLVPDSDSGVSPPNQDTIVDNVTNDTTPAFWGRAEADTIVRLYADVNGNDTLELGIDVFLGQTTAIPLDGNLQEPDGYWTIQSIVDLNDPNHFPVPDGARTIFVTAEDVAGNVNPTANPVTLLNCRAALKIDMSAALENRHFEEWKIRSVGFLATLRSPGAYDAEPTQYVEDPICLGLT